jgi:FkbM family methyltransferase
MILHKYLLIIYKYLNYIIFRPKLFLFHNKKLINAIEYLGSDYGGWSYYKKNTLQESLIISAGLGEDASFDVEFASRYDATVIIVDPTPRAIKHFEMIKSNIGSKKIAKYSNSGFERIESYDLSIVSNENLKLIQMALWKEDGYVNFYEPKNPDHVSYSILNIQNSYSTKTSSLRVPCISISSLVRKMNINESDISIIKLDIEGAEIEVLNNMIMKKIFPEQILVEFDELNFPTFNNYIRVLQAHSLLKKNKYKLLKIDGISNFLYVR